MDASSRSRAMPRTRRAFVKAFAISLCAHAALVGILLLGISSERRSSLTELRVELSRGAVAQPAIHAAVPAEPKQAPAERKPKGHVDRVAHVPTPPAQAPAAMPNTAESPAVDSLDRAADTPSEAAASDAAAGELPIDLRVLEWLSRYRTYPLAARRAHIEGVVQLRVTLLPDGRLVDAHVEQSSGHPMLDQAALDLLARASPLPSDFGSARSGQIELQLPIVYRMRTSST
ncbi:MAG TPA: TonB family protein [Rudaea sp.]|nr:TonB family protein [Rudaea sp.]